MPCVEPITVVVNARDEVVEGSLGLLAPHDFAQVKALHGARDGIANLASAFRIEVEALQIQNQHRWGLPNVDLLESPHALFA
jgi:hypothetical protein